jgi:hypothetical protein
MNAPTTPTGRRPVSREMSKILADCRDLAIHRLLLTFTALLDKVGDMLMDRAGRTDVREEQSMLLDARATLKSQRPSLMGEFSGACVAGQRRYFREDRRQGRLFQSRCRQADAGRYLGDGRIGHHREHHAHRRKPLPR